MSTLLAIRGPITGARIDLTDDVVTIGRGNSCSITLQDSVVSRHHAQFVKVRLGWQIEDCQSSTGTFVNNLPVNRPTSLRPNDEVRIGHTIFLFDSPFDLQNADFTDTSVYFSSPTDETISVHPVAILGQQELENRAAVAEDGMELLATLGELFDPSSTPFGVSLKQTLERMSKLLKSDSSMILLWESATQQLRVSAAIAEGNMLADRSVLNRVYTERKALLLSDKPDLAAHPAPDAPRPSGVRSVMAAPLMLEEVCLGVLYFERNVLDAYTLKDLRLVQSLGRLVAIFVEARQRAQATMLRAKYNEGKTPIIGGSVSFRKMIEMVRRVAPSNVPVLLVGETGVGKEVVSREIHRLTAEDGESRPFVAVNCAAIPASLFEAELFGHERGAFTGAHKQRQGFIEQAAGGTLFLDEIGELDLALQPKLLRFLQEGTFFRIGGTKIHRARVRLITATNRDLVIEVKEGRFREDLFHRLSVIPIRIPPLRDRKEDIRSIAEHYCQRFAKSFNKEILGISDEAMIQLEKYQWPGNIRELTNCLERAVLLSDDKILLPRHFNFHGQHGNSIGGINDSPKFNNRESVYTENMSNADDTVMLRPLEDVEREYILRVLKVAGNNQVQAAEILGIHRNTLRKKLQGWGVI